MEDRGAEEELAGRYMQLVRQCARPLFLAGGDSEDLIQEGTFGRSPRYAGLIPPAVLVLRRLPSTVSG